VIFLEPQPTQYDLRFRLFDVPVRVHPFFWLLSLIGAGRDTTPKELLIWVAVIFVSILIHEMGHVLAFRYYGIRSHVVLYGFGGLAIPTFRGRLGPRADMAISFAGPLAGFVFAGVLVLGLWLGGIHAEFFFGWPYLVSWIFLDAGSGVPALSEQADLQALLYGLMYVNIYWGLVNLLPIYPLDGGKIARSAFEHWRMPDGYRKSLILSIATAIGMGLYGLKMESFMTMFLFGYMAFMNYQELQSFGYRGW